jgi:hypothetical protein
LTAERIRPSPERVLTSASLMVAGDAAEEATTLAWETPTLAVGPPVVVANGQATLPAREIPTWWTGMAALVFNLLLPLAEQYEARGLRLPWDDFWLALGYNQQRVVMQATWTF